VHRVAKLTSQLRAVFAYIANDRVRTASHELPDASRSQTRAATANQKRSPC
jgi:hypothetical protein